VLLSAEEKKDGRDFSLPSNLGRRRAEKKKGKKDH